MVDVAFPFRRKTTSEVSEADGRAAAATHMLEVMSESLADVELALEDEGWRRLTTQSDHEFSRQGLLTAAKLCRISTIQNPLLKRGVALRTAYVWGQGVEITVRAEENGQDVNAVLQAFLDDDGNKAVLTGGQAREECERALATDGDLFFALPTKPLTGRVSVRDIPYDEVDDIITNPQDAADPWFYLRRWTETTYSATATGAASTTVQQAALYPALTYRPRLRPKSINGVEVRWDMPVYHVRVNALKGWKFGIGDAYAALVWSRAYKDFLTDWATLVKALSKIAWKATGKGSKAQQMRAALSRRPATSSTGEPLDVGATAMLGQDMKLEAVSKSGATIDSDSGRPLAAMVASALGVSVIALLSDPGQTGARAVATTLDLPTRLEMTSRRALWTEVMVTIGGYVIDQAIKAPQGPLTGSVRIDPVSGREVITLANDQDRTIDVDWPPLDEVDPDVLTKAIERADQAGKLPPLLSAVLFMQALGVQDADEWLKKLTDEDGNFIDPLANAGQAAVDAFRRGQDPAAALR